MNRLLSHVIISSILLGVSFAGFSQSILTVDDYVFGYISQADNLEKNLTSGIRTFSLNLKKNDNDFIVENSEQKLTLKQLQQTLRQFLVSEPQSLISLILNGDFDQTVLTEKLEKSFSNTIFIKKETDWPKINTLKENGVQVIVIYKSDVASTSIEKIRGEKKYSNRFSSDPLDKLILFKSSAEDSQELFNSCIELWQTTGKTPNFIEAGFIEPSEVKTVADSLNGLRRFKGIVYYKGELLNEVSWYQTPGVVTPARFSFPLITKEQILSPYKNGYRISPGEVIHHHAMEDNPRIFTSYDIPIEDKLIYNFDFDNGAENTLETDWKNSIVKDVFFIKDPKRGQVLSLSSPNSFIDYSKENKLNFNTPISISAWIKPDSIVDFMGIIGFGSAFSLKVKDGNPDFTTATIKDHILDKKLTKGNWYHLAVVVNPEASVEFYIDGKKEGEIVTSEIKSSNQSLVIGNNIWGEQFYGSIDDLKIWDRGLSFKEVSFLFQNNKTTQYYGMYWMLGITALIFLSFLIIFIRKRNSNYPRPKETYKSIPIVEDIFSGNSFRLFGSFKITSKNKGDITSGFSPLMRQILSFLALNTAESKNGISTNKLTETFWPGVAKDKSKENRGTNIQKLRKLLKDVDGLNIVYKDQKWHLDASENVFVDVLEYGKYKIQIDYQLKNKEIDPQLVNSFLELLKPGNILPNIQSEWLDYFKNKISTDVDSLLSKVYKTQCTNLDSETNIKLANTILLFDDLNEQALGILVKELVATGKHGQAQNAYETFAKNYKALYDETFNTEYQELAENAV
ncbi:LamG-like jellyroll fold domain-containing protein [Reichenbachiella sp. MALMAid0571]|uniref:LamG domain-containing protein n=1 Tax=Reichenbachiella sp. MALMAid0571 TaxID=3143939 RepID=UPI0032DE45EB